MLPVILGNSTFINTAVSVSTLLIFFLDIVLPRDIFIPVLYLIPVCLSAFSNLAGATTLTSIGAIILTTAGYDFTPVDSPVTQAAKRTLAIILLFLAPPFVSALRRSYPQTNPDGEQRRPASLPKRRKHWAQYN